jgi:hypothetical protein
MVGHDALKMFASGQSRQFDRAPVTSGLRQKADNFRAIRHVAFVTQKRSADCIEQGPLSGATRKSFAHTEFFSV